LFRKISRYARKHRNARQVSLSKMVWDTERTGNSSTRPIVAEWTTAAERSGRESEIVDAHPRRGQWLNGSGRRR
jgi:hypothetical protein